MPGSGTRLPEPISAWPQDFLPGNVNTNKDPEGVETEEVTEEVKVEPAGLEDLKLECGQLSEENEVLKRCLRLLRDNTSLEAAGLLSAIVAFCDGNFRRKFADGLQGLASEAKEGAMPEDLGSEVRYYQSRKSTESQITRASTGKITSPAATATSEETERYEKVSRVYTKEPPVRDAGARKKSGNGRKSSKTKVQRNDLIHEQPVRDGPAKKKWKRPRLPRCPAICPKSPPVSLGGRQLRSPEQQPYFYPSDPTSKHLQSHMHTRTAFVSDLEYDALYLRSLALAAGYRALAKGLDSKEGGGGGGGGKGQDKYNYVSMDGLCRAVSGIPPSIMYMKNRQIEPIKLIHTCVNPKPTRCHPFSREGQDKEMALFRKGSGQTEKLNLRPMMYKTDERSLHSPLAHPIMDRIPKPRGPGQHLSLSNLPTTRHAKGEKKRRSTWSADKSKKGADAGGEQQPGSPGSAPQGGDYDFQAQVEPIIDQARQSLGQVTGSEPAADDLTAYSLQHTHTETQYNEDGTAVVQSDVYKKSMNWSSEEDGGGGGAEKGEGEGEEEEKEEEDPEVAEWSTRNLVTQLSNEFQEMVGMKMDGTSEDDKTLTPGEEQPGGSDAPTGESEAPMSDATEGETAAVESRNENCNSPFLSDVEYRGEGQTAQRGGAGVTSLPVVDSFNDKTNNYLTPWRDRHQATSQWLEESCLAVSQDMDWANHCSRPSPYGTLTPRHSSISASSADVLAHGGDRRLVGLDSLIPADQRPGGKVWESQHLSPGSWNWSRESHNTPATGSWCPSPRLDFFPIHPQTDQSLWVAPARGSGSNTNNITNTTTITNKSKNLLGEVAFQLERRVLDYVFANSLPDLSPGAFSSPRGRIMAAQRWRLYGYSVSNIGEMINKEALAGSSYSRGTERMLRERLRTMLDLLTPMGYDLMEHGSFSQKIINKYGLMSLPPADVSDQIAGQMTDAGLSDLTVADVQNFIFAEAESDERDTLLLILDCLRMLAIEDGRPLFV